MSIEVAATLKALSCCKEQFFVSLRAFRFDGLGSFLHEIDSLNDDLVHRMIGILLGMSSIFLVNDVTGRLL